MARSTIDTMDRSGSKLKQELNLPGGVFQNIAQAEGTMRGGEIDYNTVLGYGQFGKPDKPLTEMSLDELDVFQTKMLNHPANKFNSSASGAFQITRQNVRDLKNKFGLSGDDKFTPELQQRMAAQIWRQQGSKAWEGFKKHEGLRTESHRLAKEEGKLVSTQGSPLGGDVIPPRTTLETGKPPGAAPIPQMGEKGRTPATAASDVGRINTKGATGADSELVMATAAGFNAVLPEGYTARITSGKQARGGGGNHPRGTAIDYQIFDKDGKSIRNRGEDTSGYYEKAFIHAKAHMMHINPNKAKQMGWGGDFGVDIKSGGGERDLMHYDLSGQRGRYTANKRFAERDKEAAEIAKSLNVKSAQRGGVIPDNPLGGILGGIMPLLAHAGEMVLPRELSQGLQRIIGGEGLGGGMFDRPLGGDTFQNYNSRQVTINQTNNNTWGGSPQAAMQGRFRDVHERMTGDLVRHFVSAIA
jgi:hypothetical protein